MENQTIFDIIYGMINAITGEGWEQCNRLITWLFCIGLMLVLFKVFFGIFGLGEIGRRK